jgi:hypothetical protein
MRIKSNKAAGFARVARWAALVVLLLAARPAAAQETVQAGFSPRVTGSLVQQRPWSIGLAGQVTTVPQEPDGREAIGFGGLRVGYALGEHLALGVTDVGLANAGALRGDRWGFGLGPYAELGTFASESVQLFGQLGAPLQLRWGGDADDEAGLAPFAGAGARFWLGSGFSITLEARAQVVASRAYLAMGRVLPQGAAAVSGGLGIDFHI